MNRTMPATILASLLSACATPTSNTISANDAINTTIDKKCFLESVFILDIANDYRKGAREAELISRHADIMKSPQKREYATSKVKQVVADSPQNEFQYTVDQYSTCLAQNRVDILANKLEACIIFAGIESRIVGYRVGKRPKEETIADFNLEQDVISQRIRNAIDAYYGVNEAMQYDLMYIRFKQCSATR